VYNKLQLRTSFRNELPFETLALLAKDEEGKMDKDKARESLKKALSFDTDFKEKNMARQALQQLG